MGHLIPVLVFGLLARGPAPKLPPFWDKLDLTADQAAAAASVWQRYSADLAKLRADLRRSRAQYDNLAPHLAAVRATGPDAEKRFQKGLERFEAIGRHLEELKASHRVPRWIGLA